MYFPLLHRRKEICRVLVILQDPAPPPNDFREHLHYSTVLDFSVEVKPKSVLSTFAECQKYLQWFYLSALKDRIKIV